MKLLFVFLALCSFNVHALDTDLTTTVNQTEKNIEISVQTGERSSMCYLTAMKLVVVLPSDIDNKVGKISVVFDTTPNTICMMAFGPHRGSINLVKGNELPEIPNGEYELFINNVKQTGILEVK